MANDWFDGTVYYVTDGQIVRAIQLNNVLDALVTSFDLLPAPHASAPATKGFSEPFVISEPTANTHPLSLGGKINNTQTYATSGGSSNAYTLTLSPAATAYTAGMAVMFKANHANTGAATLNVNALGAKSLTKTDGTALIANNIPEDAMVLAMYNGTEFHINIVSTTTNSADIANKVVVVDESADTICYLGYFNGPTGNQAIKTGTNLRFNSATGELIATKFTGSATQVLVEDESADTVCYVAFFTAATGANQTPKTGTNLKFNSATGELTATSFAGEINVPTSTPASAGDTGTAGDIVWDADYIYVCIATDTWKRVAISTW
jgi:hypothetical protein